MTLTEIFSSEFITILVLRAAVVGILVSLCASLLGVSLVMKRYSMIGDGLSHVGYFALAVAAVAGVSSEYSMEAAIPIVILAAVLILKLSEKGGVGGDAACAIVSTGAIAVGTLLFNFSDNTTSDICGSLFGSTSVITVSSKDALFSVILAVIVISWFALFSRKVFAVTFDEQFSAAVGCQVGSFRTALAALTAVTIVVGMKMMGAVMISALIVFPPLSAKRIAGSFRGVVIGSAVISEVSFIIGFAVACRFSLQTGAAVVAADVAVFLLTVAVSNMRSVIRRRTAGR